MLYAEFVAKFAFVKSPKASQKFQYREPKWEPKSKPKNNTPLPRKQGRLFFGLLFSFHFGSRCWDFCACKSEFPGTRWLVESPLVVCRRMARRFGMAVGGRRSKLGTLHGPMNHESLNGAHPALVTARCNSDVQLPYRFPVPLLHRRPSHTIA